MRSTNAIAWPTIACVWTLLAAPLVAQEGTGESPSADGRVPVPDFTLTSLSGDPVQLSEFAGSVVVINFWATWCVPCVQELPHLQSYYEAHRSDGLVVLAITVDRHQAEAQVRRLVAEAGWTMPILLDPDGAVKGLLDESGATPYTMFVDRWGRLAGDHEGYLEGDEAEYLQVILSLLSEGDGGL